MPYASFLQSLLSCGLAVQLFIEREDGSLAGLVDVSRSTPSAGELGGRLWEAILKERGRASCRGSAASLGSLKDVPRAATAGVNVFAWVWVRLGDSVLGWHCSCGLLCTGKEGVYVLLDVVCSSRTIKR